MYLKQLEEWEPVTETKPGRHITLDTSGRPTESIRLLLVKLYASALHNLS